MLHFLNQDCFCFFRQKNSKCRFYNPNRPQPHKTPLEKFLVPPGVNFFEEKMDPGYMHGEVYWAMYAWQTWCSRELVAPYVAGPGFKSRGGGGVGSLFGWIFAAGKKNLRNSEKTVRVKPSKPSPLIAHCDEISINITFCTEWLLYASGSWSIFSCQSEFRFSHNNYFEIILNSFFIKGTERQHRNNIRSFWKDHWHN